MLTTTISVEFMETMTLMKSSGRHWISALPPSSVKMPVNRKEKPTEPRATSCEVSVYVTVRIEETTTPTIQPLAIEANTITCASIFRCKDDRTADTGVAIAIVQKAMPRIWKCNVVVRTVLVSPQKAPDRSVVKASSR
mmetsp:Transcript_96520/g.171603  ORF Transcript_96520/g.171603 Transcript_96520/m.171603 type:complete len:138 (-) Transcript_96520:571-984(-)